MIYFYCLYKSMWGEMFMILAKVITLEFGWRKLSTLSMMSSKNAQCQEKCFFIDFLMPLDLSHIFKTPQWLHGETSLLGGKYLLLLINLESNGLISATLYRYLRSKFCPFPLQILQILSNHKNTENCLWLKRVRRRAPKINNVCYTVYKRWDLKKSI